MATTVPWTVSVRVRPLNNRERNRSTRTCIEPTGRQSLRISNPDTNSAKDFGFSHVFWSLSPDGHEETQLSGQKEVYDALGKPMLEDALAGHDSTLVAYGQTASGKTYSVMGSSEDKGILSQLIDDLFQRLESKEISNELRVAVNYVEVYNERLRDLLGVETEKRLRVRENSDGPYIDGVKTLAASTREELIQLIELANKERTVAATKMNASSSRSHSIITLIVTQVLPGSSGEVVSKIRFADLAGSERIAKSAAVGMRLKEAININRSMSSLGSVLAALTSSKSSHVPFRDSVITYYLKDSFGGNAKMTFLATLSPAEAEYSESLSTLRFAARAKKVENKLAPSKLLTIQSEEAKTDEGAKQTAQSPQSSLNAWTTKLKESRKIQQERIAELKKQGVALNEDKEMPCLINLSEDLAFNESLMYYIRTGCTTVGRTENSCLKEIAGHIVLGGVGVQQHHCFFENADNYVYVAPQFPETNPQIFINGVSIHTRTLLYHGDKVIIGQYNEFRFSNLKRKQLRSPEDAVKPDIVANEESKEDEHKKLVDLFTSLKIIKCLPAFEEDGVEELDDLYEYDKADLQDITKKILYARKLWHWLKKNPRVDDIGKDATLKGNPLSVHQLVQFDDLHFGPLLGRGAFGSVYQGEWNGTTVAIKVISGAANFDEHRDQFEAEAALLASLRHPGVLAYIGVCTNPHTNALCLVTEYSAAGSLEAAIMSEALEMEELLEIFASVASALAYLHGRKPHAVLHRDIACRNILLFPGDIHRVGKIADVGLSRPLDPPKEDSTYTKSAYMVEQGKLPIRWSAPETLSTYKHSAKSDVYMFGMTMYEAFAREEPFATERTLPMVAAAVLTGQRPQRLDESTCPAAISDLIEQCWHNDPSKRPNMKDVVAKIQGIQHASGQYDGSYEAVVQPNN